LIARRHGQRAQGVRRIERYAPELCDDLVATIGDHSRAGCAGAIRAAVHLYRRLRDDEPALVRREEAQHQALAFLDAVGA
jgi:hypothetical protein